MACPFLLNRGGGHDSPLRKCVLYVSGQVCSHDVPCRCTLLRLEGSFVPFAKCRAVIALGILGVVGVGRGGSATSTGLWAHPLEDQAPSTE
eukprot:scaffold6201_cov137-Isochrysis_galbana.AAC.3